MFKKLLGLSVALIAGMPMFATAQTLQDIINKSQALAASTQVTQFTRNLYIGLEGPDVSALQQKLKDLGYYTHPTVTGYYGPVTAAAVSKFQQAYAGEVLYPGGLTQPTGTFGPLTRLKMLSLSAGAPLPDPGEEAGVEGGAAAAASVPGCPPGFNYSFLTGKQCARTTVSANTQTRVSQSTPSSSRSSRSRGGGSRSSSRSDVVSGAANQSNNSNPSNNSNNSNNNSSNNSSNSSNSTNSNNQGSQNSKPAKPGTIIPPGPGFSGPTPQPAAIGTGTGSDAKAIARWDVVPYQTFDGNFNVGVVAFHMSGIDRVEFSANGGEWVSVSSMTKNPQTGVVEYWATLRASDFPDGPVEVRAVAYPEKGVPRVLGGTIPVVTTSNVTTTNGEHSMFLYANARQSFVRPEIYVKPSVGNDANPGTVQFPVATLKQALRLTLAKDGARIILTEPGQYNADRDTDPWPLSKHTDNARWVTVEPAAGLSRADVEIGGSGDEKLMRVRVGKVHWKNVTFRPDTYAWVEMTNQWYDNALVYTPGVFTNGSAQWRNNVYATDSRVENYIYGFVGMQLVRNGTVANSLDAFQRSQLIINSSIEKMRAAGQVHHPDIYQTWGDMKNVIVYGLTGRDIDGTQVIFINQPLVEGPDMTDAALVNVDIVTHDKNGGPPFSQLQGFLNNVLFDNVKVPNQNLIFRTDMAGTFRFRASNVVFRNSQFYNSNSFNVDTLPPSVEFNGAACSTGIINSSTNVTGYIGKSFIYLPTVSSGKASFTLSSGSLPQGLMFANNAITGIPSQKGTYSVVIASQTNCNKDEKTLMIRIVDESASSGAGSGNQQGGTSVVPIAHYTFNQGDVIGTTVKDVAGGNDATLVGGARVDDGMSSKALALDHSANMYAKVNSFASPLTTEGTISFWTKVGSYRRYDSYVTSVAGFGIWQENNGGIRVSGGPDITAGTVPLNTWTHVTVAWSPQFVTVYVNGAPAGRKIFAQPLALNLTGKALFIGSDRGIGARSLDGYIDDVRIYNRTLSDADVQSVYSSQTAVINNANVRQAASVGEAVNAILRELKMLLEF